MKTELSAILRWFVSMLYGLFSDPQRVRLMVLVVVVGVALAALFVPVLTATADGLSGGGAFGPH